MSTETEIKVKIENAGDFCRQLSGLNPETLAERHFEDNFLLDFPDGRLGGSRCLLRVRFAAGRQILTYKGPPRAEGIFKVREEVETGLEDGEALLQVLKQIGMSVSFRYQKYRREFALGRVHVSVDETPIGDFAELEGSEAGILDLAGRLGIGTNRFLRSSYFSLYLDHCREKGTAVKFMVFDSEALNSKP